VSDPGRRQRRHRRRIWHRKHSEGRVGAILRAAVFVAEAFTKRPGSHVSRAEALRGCREILDGLHDDLPVDAFYFTGGIDDIRKGGAPG